MASLSMERRLHSLFYLENDLARALIGEVVGTAILVFVGDSAVAQNVLTRGTGNTMVSVSIGFGLAIAFGIACCARISGGHINPAVSLMFVTFGQLSICRFLLYMCAQIAGAFLGAAATFAVYYDAISDFDGNRRQSTGKFATAGIFSSFPAKHLGVFNGFVDQFFATAVFCLCIAHLTDKRNCYPSWLQPMLIGLSFTMVCTAFSLNCGCPANPARDLGPRIFTSLAGYRRHVFSIRKFSWFWIPIVAPFLGALAGGWIYLVALGMQTPRLDEQHQTTPETPSPVPYPTRSLGRASTARSPSRSSTARSPSGLSDAETGKAEENGAPAPLPAEPDIW